MEENKPQKPVGKYHVGNFGVIIKQMQEVGKKKCGRKYLKTKWPTTF